ARQGRAARDGPPRRRNALSWKAPMLNFNINLTSLAVILWSGMLVIAGSIWVLSSQVRKLADILEEQARRVNADHAMASAPSRTAVSCPTTGRRIVASSRVARGRVARARIGYASLAAPAANPPEEGRREEGRLAS